jgi:hypothetical protein
MHVERRAHRRIRVNCPARLFVPPDRVVEAVCLDLSVGGLTLRAPYVPRHGQTVEVEVIQPTSLLAMPPLRVRAQVKRCHIHTEDLYDIGLCILEIVA